jgi:predicted nucleic acid-binding protein
MPATPYTTFVQTIDRYAARLHAAELYTLRHAADAVFFSEDDSEQAVADAKNLLDGPLALDERLGREAAEHLNMLLDSVESILALN